MWATWEDYDAEGPDLDLVGLRSMVVGDSFCHIGVTVDEARRLSAHRIRGSYIISECDCDIVGHSLQGEFTWVNGQYWLRYTHSLLPMREALALFGKHAYGWQVNRLMAYHMLPSEVAMVMDLLEKYKGDTGYPVIEFTVMKRPMGIFGMKTVIWEVRTNF